MTSDKEKKKENTRYPNLESYFFMVLKCSIKLEA